MSPPRWRAGVGASRHALVLSGGSAAGQFLTAALTVLAARASTPAELGLYVSLFALAAWVIALVEYGFSAHAARELASERMSSQEFWARTVSKQAIGLVILGVCSVPAGVLLPDAARLLVVGVVILSWLRLLSLSLSGVLRASGEFGRLATAAILEPAVAVGCFFLFMPVVSTGVAAMVLGQTVGAAVSVLTMFIWARGTVGRVTWAWAMPWRGVHGFGQFSLAVSVSGLDVPAVAAVGGEAAAGEFGVVRRIVSPLLILAGALNTTTLRYASRARSGEHAFRELTSQWPLFAIAGVASVGLALSAPSLVPLLLGTQYASAAPALAITALAGGLAVCNSVSATLLQARGRDRSVAVIMWIAVIVQFALIAVLVPRLGATGAALSYAGLHVFFALLILMQLNRLRRMRAARTTSVVDDQDAATFPLVALDPSSAGQDQPPVR